MYSIYVNSVLLHPSVATLDDAFVIAIKLVRAGFNVQLTSKITGEILLATSEEEVEDNIYVAESIKYTL